MDQDAFIKDLIFKNMVAEETIIILQKKIEQAMRALLVTGYSMDEIKYIMEVKS